MATRTISTRIALDGEAEFKKQMSQVNGELKNLKSEMGLVTAEFKDNANSAEALTAKSSILRKEIDQQAEKVRALEQAVKDSTEAYGEADSKTDKYKQALNKAKTELIEMNRELKETDERLEDVGKGFDDVRDGADKAGGSIGDMHGDMSTGIGVIDDFAGKLSGLGVLGAAGAVVGGMKAIVDSIGEVVESTEEYRKIMGTLEVSSQKAGYSAEETADQYSYLFAVLGDEQSTATTIANLQALGLEHEDLLELIDATVGAWASYGDSIPIDGLAEAINETVKVGEVTGNFADVLNWAGQDQDAFNERLAQSRDEAERMRLVLDMLAMQGLPDVGKEWRAVNADIVATNEATLKLESATARLGETLSPVQAKITEFKASVVDAANWAVSTVFAGGTGEGNGGAASGAIAAAKAEQAQAKWNKSSDTVFNSRVGSGGGVLAGALGNSGTAPAQEVVINITESIDGATLARNQYRYNTREGNLRGGSLVEVGK